MTTTPTTTKPPELFVAKALTNAAREAFQVVADCRAPPRRVRQASRHH